MRISSGVLATLLIFTGFTSAAAAPAVPEVMKLSVGEVVMFKLPGNRRAGYTWALNMKSSRGLELVSVDEIGWIMAPEAMTIFQRKKPSVINFAVRATAAGEADLAFDYFRSWGNRVAIKSRTLRVIVGPAATARK